MSPEYAIKGIVSVKTDVFSFGVLLLEIVSGKRSNSCYQSEHPLNLIGLVRSLLTFMREIQFKMCLPSENFLCEKSSFVSGMGIVERRKSSRANGLSIG